MSKIINFYGFHNQNINNEKIEQINKIYKENFLKEKDIIFELTKLNDLKFLINNFNDLNNNFLILDTKKIDFFLQLIIDTLKKENKPALKVWKILYSYNLYRVYGEKLSKLSSDNVNTLISLLISFERDYDIKNLDSICDFMFDDKIRKELDFLSLPKNELVHLLENAIDEYLDEEIKTNYTIKYYVESAIKDYKESKFKIKKDLSLDTPESIYEYLKGPVLALSRPLIDSDQTLQNNMGIELQNNLDMLVFKLKNMKQDDLEICINLIKKIINSDNYSLIDKIELSFDFIDQFYGKDDNNIKKI